MHHILRDESTNHFESKGKREQAPVMTDISIVTGQVMVPNLFHFSPEHLILRRGKFADVMRGQRHRRSARWR